MPHPQMPASPTEEAEREKAGSDPAPEEAAADAPGPLLLLEFPGEARAADPASSERDELEAPSGEAPTGEAPTGEAPTGTVVLVEGLAALEAAAERDGQARCLILHEAAELGLARRIEQGLPVREALEAWCADARRLLAFLRRYRRRSLLLDSSAFWRDPEQALRQLDLPQQPESPAPEPREAEPPPEPPPDPLARLVAMELLRRNPRAGALAGELEASTRALAGGEQDPLDLDWAYREYARRVPQAAVVEREAPPPRTGEPDANGPLAELREEHEAVLEQLLKAQEIAEKQRRRAQEAERWLAKRNAKLEWIYASRTYRATIPLRWLGMKLGGKKPGHWHAK